MYSKKEVVELVKEFEETKECVVPYNWEKFCTEKGLIEEFEVGKWYKSPVVNGSEDAIVCITDLETKTGYGFNYNGNWNDKEVFVKERSKEATSQEVEAALIKEAKKRGFKGSIKTNKSFWITKEGFFYDDGVLYYGSKDSSNVGIFQDGKWASIIEEENPINKVIDKAIKDLEKLKV